MIQAAKKLIATGLSAILILLAPGLDVYRAAAEDIFPPAPAEGAVSNDPAAPVISLSAHLNSNSPAALANALNQVRVLRLHLRQAAANPGAERRPALDAALESAANTEAALLSEQNAAAGGQGGTLESRAEALESLWQDLRKNAAAPSIQPLLARRIASPAALPAAIQEVQSRQGQLAERLAAEGSAEDTAAAARRVLDGTGPSNGSAAPVAAPQGSNALQDAAVAEIAAALNAGDWSHPGLADAERTAILAREAYRQGKISEAQFITTVLRWEGFSDFQTKPGDFKALRILNSEGKLTDEARELLGSGAVSLDKFDTAGIAGREDLADRFESRVRELPESERYYWVLHIDRGGKYEKSIREFADAFSPARTAADGHTLVLPSFGLLQAKLQGRFGDDALKLLPAFSDTSRDQIVQQIGGGGRVFGLSFPGEQAFEAADGLATGKLLFSLHDYFHAYLGSVTPPAYRRLFPRIADIARGRGGDNERLFDELADLLVFRSLFSGPAVKQLLSEFGPVFSRDSSVPLLTYFLVRDMALNPAAWDSIDVQKAVSKMGREAVKVYNEARREAAPEQARVLELRFDSPRTSLLLAVALGVSWIPFLGTMAVHEAGHFLAARLLGVRVDHVVLFKATRSLRNVNGEVKYDSSVSPLKDIVILLAGPGLALVNAGLKLFSALELHHILHGAFAAGTLWAGVASSGTIAAAVLAAGSLVYALCGFSMSPGSDLRQAWQRYKQWKSPEAGSGSQGNGFARAPELFAALAALPAVYEAARWKLSQAALKALEPSFSRRVEEWFKAGMVLGLAAFGANVLHVFFSGVTLLPAAIASVFYCAAQGGMELFRDSRSEVVGGWQASHDQRYRVGPDGNLRDVRGHAYGKDRYDATAPGPVRSWEQFTLTVLSFATGLLLWSNSSTFTAIYSGAFLAITVLGDLTASWRARDSKAVYKDKVSSLSRPILRRTVAFA